jgi:cell division protease FtsH
MQNLRKRQFTFSSFYLIIAVLFFWAVQALVLSKERPQPIPYSEFLTLLDTGKVSKVEIRSTQIVAALKETQPGSTAPKLVAATRLPGIDDTSLLADLQKRKVTFSGRIDDNTWFETLLGWFLPFIVLGGIYFFSVRRMNRGAGPLSFGKARPKIHDLNEQEKVTFADVAGVDEAEGELMEMVSFLKEPQKYRALGARIPKGVLLVGPPGTGKTLLARAVAGEAGVPFFSLSGSEFVEMFVGVGAARVRDLFEQAKQRAPCIVFIDELDAIGRSRAGVGAFGTHEEREQTLNQLLVEMDGFDSSKGVIIMAATNRPEVLDPALLRAGRFDRQVLVDRPDIKGRLEILKVHTRKLKLDKDVDLEVVARRTPGSVGADLANMVNEAALGAARRGAQEVSRQDFEEAIDRMQMGLKKNTVLSEREKSRVAYHEAGHTLVALSVKNADPVHRVTIIPRSIGALGATLQLPTEEHHLITREELRDRICVMVGGRAAEEVVCGDISTGAHDDLQRATETARQMVTKFGMSDKLGPITYGRATALRFLGGTLGSEEQNYSEETARLIDSEVRSIVEEEKDRARQILEAKRTVLDAIVRELLDKETLDRPELEALAGASEQPAAGNQTGQAAA